MRNLQKIFGGYGKGSSFLFVYMSSLTATSSSTHLMKEHAFLPQRARKSTDSVNIWIQIDLEAELNQNWGEITDLDKNQALTCMENRIPAFFY